VATPYDSTLKHLIDTYPQDWARFLGAPADARIEVVESDLSTLTLEADKVLRVDANAPWLLHLEYQSTYDWRLPRRMLRYNVLLEHRHAVPVESMVLLVRPLADGPGMTGREQLRLPSGKQYLEFTYTVLRLWEIPPERFLEGGPGLMPLALVAHVREHEFPGIVRRMEVKATAELPPSQVGDLWSAAFILMGLRYEPGFIEHLLKGVTGMEESSTYQLLLRRGEERGLEQGRERLASSLYHLGTRRFGEPSARVCGVIDAEHDLDRLTRMLDRILDVESWRDLLASEGLESKRDE
jgi:hypothetical protein